LLGTSVAQQYREGNAVNITLSKAMHVRQQYKGNALMRFHGKSGHANAL
jgi:ribosomal protein L21E